MKPTRLAVASTVLAIALPAAARADDDAPPWRFDLGLSYVATTGNSTTTSAGLESSLHRDWGAWVAEAFLEGVFVTEEDETTAERYSGGARVERSISERLSATGGWKGERDRFAGLSFRSVTDLGVQWRRGTDDDPWVLSVTGAATWTHDALRGDESTSDYVGSLLAADSVVRLSETASARQRVNLYTRIDDTDDWRFEARISLRAAISSALAVKLGYEYRFDNTPVPGFGSTDTVTRASLVVTLEGHGDDVTGP